jgi:hypothetical protein
VSRNTRGLAFPHTFTGMSKAPAAKPANPAGLVGLQAAGLVRAARRSIHELPHPMPISSDEPTGSDLLGQQRQHER